MDNLKTPAHKFYSGEKLFAKHDKPMDAAGQAIILEACRRREEDEEYRREQQAADLMEQIKGIRTRCLKLLRDMRPIRKGCHGIPESICETLRNSVQGYVEEIATLRGELEGLK